MGVFTQGSTIWGTPMAVSGRSDHHVVFTSDFVAGPPGSSGAPSAIHRRIRFTCSVDNGSPPLGIRGFSPEITLSSRLPSGLPATTAPLSINDCRLTTDTLPLESFAL